MRRVEQDDDERVLGDRVLAPGRSLRVPMTMMDHAMRDAIDEVFPRRVKDAALHRPGFRALSTTAARDAKARAYFEYERSKCDEYKDPNAGRGDPLGTGTHELQGSKAGQPCTKNGHPGVLVQGPNGTLVCEIAEAGSEEFERDEDENGNTEQHDHDVGSVNAMRDGIKQLAHEAGLVSDQDGDWDDDSWDKFVNYARKVMMGEEEDAGDRDRGAMIERITRATTTPTENTPPQRFDGMTPDQLRARHVERMRQEYALADAELADAWRKP